MEPRDITERIKAAVRKSETEAFPAMDKVWDRIEEKLDEQKKTAGKAIPFRQIALAAALLLLISLGLIYITRHEASQPVNTETYTQQEQRDILPVKPEDKAGAQSIARMDSVDKEKPVPDKIAHADQPEQKVNQEDRRPVKKNRSVKSIDDAVTVHRGNFHTPEVLRGRVTDATGEGIPGASVVLKGTHTGTVTDINGYYTLQISSTEQQLKISAASMEPVDVRVNDPSAFPETRLSASTQYAMNDVQIYGQKVDKKSYTGAISTITAADIAKRPVTSIEQALSGAAPGVNIISGRGQPGASPDIQARGQGSLSADQAPLIVVDGAPYNGSLTSIRSDDVVSMTVLKDASATAIYGSRGTHGVIIIVTKNAGPPQDRTSLLRKIRKLFQKKSKD